MIVAATQDPHPATASSAAAVVQCSNTMRRRGKAVWIWCRVGKKRDSAVRMLTGVSLAACSLGLGVGTSPCKLSTRLCCSIAPKTG